MTIVSTFALFVCLGGLGEGKATILITVKLLVLRSVHIILPMGYGICPVLMRLICLVVTCMWS